LVALGDSFTSGHGESVAGEPCRSWVEHVAELIRRERGATPSTLNLARYGATVAVVTADQLPGALAARAEVFSVVVGANDVRQARWDQRNFELALSDILRAGAATGASLIVGNLPNFALTVPLRDLRTKLALQARIFEANEVAERLARDAGALLLDFCAHPATRDLRNYSSDLIHPNARGHRVIADFIHQELVRWTTQRAPAPREKDRGQHAAS
jgi:lysophospholipase L1-like esterase